MAYSNALRPDLRMEGFDTQRRERYCITLAFQSSIDQVGDVVGPQLFLEKYAYNGYKVPFAVCAACSPHLLSGQLLEVVAYEQRRLVHAEASSPRNQYSKDRKGVWRRRRCCLQRNMTFIESFTKRAESLHVRQRYGSS